MEERGKRESKDRRRELHSAAWRCATCNARLREAICNMLVGSSLLEFALVADQHGCFVVAAATVAATAAAAP